MLPAASDVSVDELEVSYDDPEFMAESGADNNEWERLPDSEPEQADETASAYVGDSAAPPDAGDADEMRAAGFERKGRTMGQTTQRQVAF